MPIIQVRQATSCRRRYGRWRRTGSEDGAIAVMTPFIILVMIAMFGMAIDLSRTYNRKMELQSVADAVALAAASAWTVRRRVSTRPSRKLNGPSKILPSLMAPKALSGRAML